MLNGITIGQFFPGESTLHRLDPRTKIVLLLLTVIAIFVFDTPGAYAVLASLAIALLVMAKVPLRLAMRSLRSLWWLVLFSFSVHAFTTPGEPLFSWWVLEVTDAGIEKGILISVRLALLLVLSSLITFTTSPLRLTDALENLLRPFKRLGLPAHELAMMMTIALRFIPTLSEEADRIIKAQESRGADFLTGNIVKRLKSMVPIIVPLFVSAFRRAGDLALAMEARCYRGGEGRTHLKELRFTSLDYMAGGTFILLVALLAWLKWMGI